MKINQAFQKRLNEILKEQDNSIFRMCKGSGIGRSTITNIYSGATKSPTLATLFEVCDALDISIIEFLNCELFQRNNIEID